MCDIDRRYVKNGANGFGGGFGQECPTPDFAAARTFEQTQATKRTTQLVKSLLRRVGM
jgi:hypothetical protein